MKPKIMSAAVHSVTNIESTILTLIHLSGSIRYMSQKVATKNIEIKFARRQFMYDMAKSELTSESLCELSFIHAKVVKVIDNPTQASNTIQMPLSDIWKFL